MPMNEVSIRLTITWALNLNQPQPRGERAAKIWELLVKIKSKQAAV